MTSPGAVSRGEWSEFKVVSTDREVGAQVVPVTERSGPEAKGGVPPPDAVVSGTWGRQCIQLRAVSLG